MSNDEIADGPPLEPTVEEVAAESPAFAAMCVESARKHIARCEGKLGTSLLTRSELWGFVWRADFTMRGQSANGFVNRIVIWGRDVARTEATIAIGQDISPLHGDAGDRSAQPIG